MAASTSDSENTKYPMLEAILAIQKVPLQPMYSTRDIAKLFSVSTRAIQSWIASGQLTPRNLPGRWRLLTQDVEDFLAGRKKGR
jgi:transposase